MSLRTWISFLILAAPGWAAFAAGPPIETFSPLPAQEAGTAVLPPGTATAAGELAAAAECHPTKRRAALVALRWEPVPSSGAGGEETPSAAQRVELTKFRDGFRTGRLETTRRLDAAVQAVAVDSPETGIAYYWRVLTLTPEGWAPSAVERFEVPICPWDEPDLSRFQAGLADDRSEAGS